MDGEAGCAPRVPAGNFRLCLPQSGPTAMRGLYRWPDLKNSQRRCCGVVVLGWGIQHLQDSKTFGPEPSLVFRLLIHHYSACCEPASLETGCVSLESVPISGWKNGKPNEKPPSWGPHFFDTYLCVCVCVRGQFFFDLLITWKSICKG